MLLSSPVGGHPSPFIGSRSGFDSKEGAGFQLTAWQVPRRGGGTPSADAKWALVVELTGGPRLGQRSPSWLQSHPCRHCRCRAGGGIGCADGVSSACCGIIFLGDSVMPCYHATTCLFSF